MSIRAKLLKEAKGTYEIQAEAVAPGSATGGADGPSFGDGFFKN